MFNNKLKRILSIFIAIVMILCIVSITTYADSSVNYDVVESETTLIAEEESENTSTTGFWMGVAAMVTGCGIGGFILFIISKKKSNFDEEDE